eukprot:11580737-Alexandrium_andersonii.AAC.1
MLGWTWRRSSALVAATLRYPKALVFFVGILLVVGYFERSWHTGLDPAAHPGSCGLCTLGDLALDAGGL